MTAPRISRSSLRFVRVTHTLLLMRCTVRRATREKTGMPITIMTRTRQHGVEPCGDARRTSAAGLIAVAENLGPTLRAVRSFTDSAAHAWVEVDGRQVEVDGILYASTASEKRAAANLALASLE